MRYLLTNLLVSVIWYTSFSLLNARVVPNNAIKRVHHDFNIRKKFNALDKRSCWTSPKFLPEYHFGLEQRLKVLRSLNRNDKAITTGTKGIMLSILRTLIVSSESSVNEAGQVWITRLTGGASHSKRWHLWTQFNHVAISLRQWLLRQIDQWLPVMAPTTTDL